MSNNREYVDLGHVLAMIKNGEMAHSTLEAAMAQCIESNMKEIARLRDALLPFAEPHYMGDNYVKFAPRLIEAARTALK